MPRPVRFFMVQFLLLLLFISSAIMPRPLWADEATIFIYHRFADPRYPSTNVTAEIFAAQLDVLARGDYVVLPLGKVVDLLAAKETLPEKCVVLTVDDAFSSFAETGLPLLEKHGFPVTLFVNTGSVGRPGYLDWDQLRELEKRGVEIASHGYGHLHMAAPLAGETADDWALKVRSDLAQAQADFQRELGYRPDIFAYPYGEYSPELIELVKAEGFEAAVAQQSGVAGPYSDRFALPRFPMGGPYATLKGFSSKLQMHAMPVEVLRPRTPLLGADNPPTLEVLFPVPGHLGLSRLNCFVNGKPECEVTRIAGDEEKFRIVAKTVLNSRRSKYTLTVQDRQGDWFWFSWLWLNPAIDEGY